MRTILQALRHGIPLALAASWYANHVDCGEDDDEEEESDGEAAPDVADVNGNGGDDPAESNDSIEVVVGLRIRDTAHAAETLKAEEEDKEEYAGGKDKEDYDGDKDKGEDKDGNKGKGDKGGDGGGGSARTCA